MKKSTIWTIACVMGVSLLTLLYLQFSYFEAVYNMRKDQFVEAAARSIGQTAQDLELSETQTRLETELAGSDSTVTESSDTFPTLSEKGGFFSTPHLKDAPKHIDAARYHLKDKQVVEDILTLLYEPSDKPLASRIDFKELDSMLKIELGKNGIYLPYHFRVTTSDGREIYRCGDYNASGEESAYRQELFPNDERPQMGLLYVHFPDMQHYVFDSVRFMIPALIFTLILLVIFTITIYTLFRQKRLSEIKNDFINNMTHEFKTPISTISLAAQMLNDPTVTKSESMFRHISSVINDETKRLRFQVEKVLQMSMFDKKAATFRKREVDADRLIADVINTFRLKVESTGGHIESALNATDTVVFVDEMHFTNVIFNLMDNAIKYKKSDEDLTLRVTTRNKDGRLIIAIADNGIGIKKEDLKKIFEKFYRVHTGNRHDVKGFGLGLAYVKNVISNLGGTIVAESDYGKGTIFIITLPILKNGTT